LRETILAGGGIFGPPPFFHLQEGIPVVQVCILVFSSASIFFFSSKKKFRYGFVAGLMGQPFWIYETWRAGQYGMFLVSVWFTAMQVRGIWNNFALFGRGRASR